MKIHWRQWCFAFCITQFLESFHNFQHNREESDAWLAARWLHFLGYQKLG